LGYAVGVLDVDLCGPSAPRMLLGGDNNDNNTTAQQQQIRQSAAGHWLPVYTTHNNIAVLSISFLLSDTNAAVIWRGPRKNSLIQQFLTQTDWTGETDGLDYLIVDTPPGTSDEHISIVQYLARAQKMDGAIVVTTPEEASIADVRKELSFCQKTNVPVLGIVENMGTLQTDISKFQFYNPQNQQDCTDQVLERLRNEFPELFQYQISTNLFTIQPGTAEHMAKEYGTEFWGRIPLDPLLLYACEHGQPFVVDQYPQSQAARALDTLAKKLVQKCPVEVVVEMQS
jgi:Mrp family chromosome partitioning ATPase